MLSIQKGIHMYVSRIINHYTKNHDSSKNRIHSRLISNNYVDLHKMSLCCFVLNDSLDSFGRRTFIGANCMLRSRRRLVRHCWKSPESCKSIPRVQWVVDFMRTQHSRTNNGGIECEIFSSFACSWWYDVVVELLKDLCRRFTIDTPFMCCKHTNNCVCTCLIFGGLAGF